MILNAQGKPISYATERGKLDQLMDEKRNIFEGMAEIKIYNDAISIKGRCAFCDGLIEGVLRFPDGYSMQDPDARLDAKRQAMAKVQRDHYCIPRLDGPKLPIQDFLRRFE